MIYWFRVYGRGWVISNNLDIIKRKYKKYKEEGLARGEIFKRHNWVMLD